MTINRLNGYAIGKQLGAVTEGLSAVSRQVAIIDGKLDRMAETQAEQAQAVGTLCGRVDRIEEVHEQQALAKKETETKTVDRTWAIRMILLSALLTQSLNLILSHWR